MDAIEELTVSAHESPSFKKQFYNVQEESEFEKKSFVS